MKKTMTDFRLIIGFLLAHVLLYLTFDHEKVFWYMFTASILILISYAIMREELDDFLPLPYYLTYGVVSGFLLFGLFWVGDYFFALLKIPVQKDISRLYKLFSPTMFWQFLSLMLIAVPGEEIFWRGFIQKKLLKHTNFWGSIFLSSIMYASVHLYSGKWILVFAAFISGLVWSFLYGWKKSIPLVIVSHLIFDLFLFILFPL